MKPIKYIIIFLFSTVSIAQNTTLFNVGNTLYNNGNFEEAISKYDAVLKTGHHSAELYYNMANAYYKLNEIAQSIYYYEKALLLSPNDEDIKTNLAFAQRQTVDVINEIPQLGFSKFIDTITNKFSFDYWAKLTIGFVVVFVILFLVYYFLYQSTQKRITFIASMLMLMLASATLFFAFKQYNYEQNNTPAIVFAKETEIKTEPNLKSPAVFKLHEGTKVKVLEAYDKNWSKIKIADGKTGWVINEDIKLLNVF